MKARDRFDKILFASCDRIQEEVAALLGKPFKLDQPRFRQIDKEELFADQRGQRVLAHVRIEGDVQGEGCLLVDVRDAIHIGGALIMLPESELASVIQSEDYSEELADSFGEIANIICGAITVTFEEQYPKKVRFIRVEQEVVASLHGTVQSQQPIADTPWYVMSVSMHLGGRELGELDLMIPASPFGLMPETSEAVPASSPAVAQSPMAAASDPTTGPEEKVQSEKNQAAGRKDGEVIDTPAAIAAEPGSAQGDRVQQPARGVDNSKQKKLVDALLKSCMDKTAEEVSGLLGGCLEIVPEGNEAVSKADFLKQAGAKQVMSRMDIRGEHQGEAFLFVDIKSAIFLGGTLIMLPESELEETVRQEKLGEDAQDAYGEISNIIAGVYTAVFEQQYGSRVGFVKTTMEHVVPAKVAPDSDAVFPDQIYYQSVGKIRYDDKELGQFQFLFPLASLDLQGLLVPPGKPMEDVEQAVTVSEAINRSEGIPAGTSDRVQDIIAQAADILIYTDDKDEGEKIAAILRPMGYAPQILRFKDPVSAVVASPIRLIFLVMREVNEQGFGVAIKISAAGLAVPLVVAGPAWTRSMVLKAVKYGASDILMTPSTVDDVREKIELNLVKQAA
jgi:chemotaxis protein CheY-P-specific phosphatase CheC